MSNQSITMDSPLGKIILSEKDGKLSRLEFTNEEELLKTHIIEQSKNHSEFLQYCVNQLLEYFKGKRIVFDIPLYLEGTEFQKKVWQELINIPYGQIATYKDIAIRVGNEKAVRAVGGANNKNKIAIVIPCHRVIGCNGKLVGYAGGMWRKEWLLEQEKN